MKSFLISVSCFFLIPVTAVYAGNCIQFVLPDQGSVIDIPSCTLQVDAKCENIKSVEFQARYFKTNNDTPVISSLGIISRPPFKLVWDVTEIPNQLLSGVSFLAEATFSKDSTETVKREGVFFTHQKITRPSLIIPYEFSGTKAVSRSIVFTLLLGNVNFRLLY